MDVHKYTRRKPWYDLVKNPCYIPARLYGMGRIYKQNIIVSQGIEKMEWHILHLLYY